MGTDVSYMWLGMFFAFISSTYGNLNLFMNNKETTKLLGIPGALYYVRKGEINKYALNFNMPIPAQYERLHFQWQSLRQSPPHPAMYYSMSISHSSSDNKVLGKPSTLNIANEGTVPTTLTSFTVILPCTGKVSGEIDVHINMNISIFSASNLTQITIQRRKICIKNGTRGHGEVVDVYNVRNNKKKIPDNPGVRKKNPIDIKSLKDLYGNSSVSQNDAHQAESTPTNVFYITVGCACAFILFVAFIVAALYVRSQKSGRTDREFLSDVDSTQAITQPPQTYLRPDTPNNASIASLPTSVSTRRAPSTSTFVSRPTIPDPVTSLREIQIERKFVRLVDIIMEGTFGRIYSGTVITDEEGDFSSEQNVYIKTVKAETRHDQVQIMLSECCVMKGMSHVNINSVVATVIDEHSPPLLIYPYMNEGNLKQFLLTFKVPDLPSQALLSTQQLVYIAIQIIRGLQYLHRRKVVHKDVATRNCVVDSNLQVRVTDHALSRDLYPADYHCLGDNENRPVKWLALESLVDRRFSPASDVWSFGVLLWELTTLGQQPYAEIDPFEMASYIKEGYRAAQPINCPDELFTVMACCWAMLPDERPKFKDLLSCLVDFYSTLGQYV